MTDYHSAPTPSSETRTRLLAVATTLLVVAALRATEPVTRPLAVAVVIIVLAWPLQIRLARRVPQSVAFVLTLVAIVTVASAIAGAALWGAHAVVEREAVYSPRVAALAARAGRWLRGQGAPVPGALDAAAAGFPDPTARGGPTAAGSAFFGGTARALGEAILCSGYVILGLLEVGAFRAKIARRVGGTAAETALEATDQIADKIRASLWAKTVTAFITGVATLLVCGIARVELAATWAVLAFILKYVPVFGSFVAIVPPTVFALVEHDRADVARGLTVGITLAVVQLVTGNLIGPKLEGRFLALSPLVVLFSMAFWGWVWGITGALLGVPLTAGVVIACDHFDSTRWIANLLTEYRLNRRGRPEGIPLRTGAAAS